MTLPTGRFEPLVKAPYLTETNKKAPGEQSQGLFFTVVLF
jgi:hypothetical protein